MEERDKLKPCPFCRSAHIIRYQVKPSWTNPYWRIGCPNCGKWFIAEDCTEEEAIKAWNEQEGKR